MAVTLQVTDGTTTVNLANTTGAELAAQYLPVFTEPTGDGTIPPDVTEALPVYVNISSDDNLASYTGLVPSTKSSGGVERCGRITREGSRWLRLAMMEVALMHLRCDTPLTRFYHRVAERRGRKPALVAAACKLVTVCYATLVNRRPY